MKRSLRFVFLPFLLTAFAQAQKPVIRARAYFTVPIPGTIMVDDNGRPMQPQHQKMYSVFLQIKKGAALQWDNAWTDGKCFTVTTVLLNTDSVVVGKRRNDDKKILLPPLPGTNWQQLELSATAYRKPPKAVSTNALFLAGKLNGKPFYYKISPVIELASPDYQ